MSEPYKEGYCEIWDSFAQLYDKEGKMICAECMEDKGETPHEDED